MQCALLSGWLHALETKEIKCYVVSMFQNVSAYTCNIKKTCTMPYLEASTTTYLVAYSKAVGYALPQ